MGIEDYLQEFECTSICVSFENASNYTRNELSYQIENE